jgi:UDP-GlcNAc:undecaprenyl-phosphate GlcNAc-1-phosphate transferase
MTTVLVVFLISLVLSLILTPMAAWLGRKLGAMDIPNERKVHSRPIPRSGGLAICMAFVLTLIFTRLAPGNMAHTVSLRYDSILPFAGMLTAFGVGAVDDFHRLGPKVKFLFQIMAASLAFFGGIQIQQLQIGTLLFSFTWLAWPVTVFWFLLLTNAINLVDGLDGLAGGIVFFATLVLMLLSVMKNDWKNALTFAALAGSVLGFLRYNFNPANVFLGDGGSYFLGFVMAALSIEGSSKTQMGVTLLMPVLALGVPLFDTLLSTVRRFVRGRNMFYPDRQHIHHRLVKMGLSTRRTVMLLYVITFILCLLALFMVNMRDERSGFILMVLGACAVVFVRKLGYFDYFDQKGFWGWLGGLSDEIGFSRERRSFLSIQIDIDRASDTESMWNHIVRALKMLEMDFAALYLNEKPPPVPERYVPETGEKEERRRHPPLQACVALRQEPPWRQWTRKTFMMEETLKSRCLFRLELPLCDDNSHVFGTLVLCKDVGREPIGHYTLRRLEHLRRTIMRRLLGFKEFNSSVEHKTCTKQRLSYIWPFW